LRRGGAACRLIVATATKGARVFESIAVLTTLSLAAVFAFLVRQEYRSRQQDKHDADL